MDNTEISTILTSMEESLACIDKTLTDVGKEVSEGINKMSAIFSINEQWEELIVEKSDTIYGKTNDESEEIGVYAVRQTKNISIYFGYGPMPIMRAMVYWELGNEVGVEFVHNKNAAVLWAAKFYETHFGEIED